MLFRVSNQLFLERKMMLVLLSILTLVSALAMIRADYTGLQKQIYLFKPLTMVFIVMIAFGQDASVSTTYKTLILIGLLFSMMGDAWLMMPKDRFIFGLVSFLVAHLFYIAAFSSVDNHLAAWWFALPLLIVIGGAFLYLYPALGSYRVPVIVYMLVIGVMGFQSLNRWEATHDTAGLLAVVGALFFMTSDTILAINKFRQPFYAAQALILSTYFVAQWLIAQSI